MQRATVIAMPVSAMPRKVRGVRGTAHEVVSEHGASPGKTVRAWHRPRVTAFSRLQPLHPRNFLLRDPNPDEALALS